MELPSDQQLEAFVDGQLCHSDRAAVLIAMDESVEIRAKVADLRQLKDIINLAYHDKLDSIVRPVNSIRNFAGFATAAVAGALAMLLFIQLYSGYEQAEPVLNNRHLADAPADVNSPLLNSGVSEQVLFHISGNDDLMAYELLDQVELVARQYRRWGRALRIIVIANNEGLRMYQVGRSSHANRIRDLYARYDNIVFAACGATLKRFAESDELPELLPQAIVVDSGVAEIARRQLQGWKYIRI